MGIDPHTQKPINLDAEKHQQQQSQEEAEDGTVKHDLHFLDQQKHLDKLKINSVQ